MARSTACPVLLGAPIIGTWQHVVRTIPPMMKCGYGMSRYRIKQHRKLTCDILGELVSRCLRGTRTVSKE